MRARNIKKQIWFNEIEDKKLKEKCSKIGLCEADLLRNLVLGFEPREKPDEKFYESIKQLRAIGNNLNQIARKANALGIIEAEFYKEEADKLNKFILDIKKEYLLPKKNE